MSDASTAHKPPHPSVYLILTLPFGIATGYVTVTLAWLLSHAGASVAAVAGLAGMGLLPNTWKVFWAPLIDTTLTTKAWFTISVAVTGASLAGIALLPLKVSLLPVFGGLVLLSSVAVTLAGMAVSRFMAYDTPQHQKGQAGGWNQAGNLGGVGLGGGAGLWIAVHTGQPWLAGVVLALISLACALPLLVIPNPGARTPASPTARC